MSSMKTKRPPIEYPVKIVEDGIECIGHYHIEPGNPQMIQVSYRDERPTITHLTPGVDVEAFARFLLRPLVRTARARISD
jgi:hypothetical protein